MIRYNQKYNQKYLASFKKFSSSRSIKLLTRYKKKRKNASNRAIKKRFPLVDRKSNGEAFVRLIAIQESVEIMKGADWSIGTK